MALGKCSSNPSRVFNYARARARFSALALLGALLAAPAPAAPPAGTPIDNTATGTLTLAAGTVTQPSNTVRAVVQAAEALALFPDRGGIAAPGGSVTLAHRLVNTGNAPTDIRLDARNLALDGFDAASFALTQDRDHDGRVGAGDTPIANGGALTLAAGDSADVLLTLGVPGSAPLGALALVRLSATGLAQGATALVTDTLRTPQVGSQPVIVFCDAPDYLRPTHVAGLGSPIEVEALARGCDLDPTRIETVRLTLSSRATGDREVYDATETSPHSGLFRVLPGVPTITGTRTNAAGDGVLATARGDLVTAELSGCGATTTRASVWVEPGSFVYESRSDEPVGGVRVRLIDVSGAGNGGLPGGLARVFAGDGVTPSPAEVVSDARGAFSFPLVRRSTYRLEVSPPEPWRFPSRMGTAALPGERLTDAAGSYGGTFATADSLAPVAVDVPVDAVGAIALFVEQTASRPEVEWGDALEWTVRVANQSDSTLAAVRLAERLPFGFAYVHGSARSTAGTVAEPPGVGPGLAFALGALSPHASVELRFSSRVQSGAPTGEAQAVAQAFGVSEGVVAGGSGAETPSNAAPASTRVRGDVFADEGGVVGTVSVRFTHATQPAALGALDATADAGPTTGLAGVRLYLDDGTWAVTDAQGRFSFTAVPPRTHALKLDRTTLPPHAWPVAVDHRDAGTPGLRFVDLTRGDLVRADFLVMVPADTTDLREVKDRQIAAGGRDERLRVVAQAIQRPEQRALPGDARSLPAAAIVTGEHETGAGTPARVPQAAPVPPAPPALAVRDSSTRPEPLANLDEDVLTAAPAAPPAGSPTAPPAPPPGSLEQLLPGLGAELGFVGLADMDTLAGTQVSVRVKGAIGTPLWLRLNGERVPESRVGRRVSAMANAVEAWEYVGLSLVPGVNVLELSTPHAASRVAVRVVAPGPLSRLWLTGRGALPADGHTESWLTLAVTDSAGVPVGARTLVTLNASRGLVPLDDLDPASPGIQVAVEGGRARVPLLSPSTPGRGEVVASSGTLRAVADVDFVPEMRPLLVVGTVEGAVGLDQVRSPLGGHTPRDGFEQPISEFSSQSHDGSQGAGARAALYVKGRVHNDVELTLGYDSDRPDDLRQFRDLQVDRGYPVQGDASVRGYDAQSTGKLYGRLERRDASLLYGDLVTGGSDLSLANYARSLTGAVATWGEDGTRASGGSGLRAGSSGHAFTSRERSRQVVDELPGRGVSGPYQLSRAPLVENSERVEVQVHDRDQPAVVLSTELRQRFTDYELDPLTGQLIFRSPVPSFDSELNPVRVRVTYEIDDATGAAWVSGLALRQRLTSSLSVGGTYVDDHDPAQPFELRGASALARLSARTTLEGEWAATHTLAGTGATTAGAGDAGRIELRHDDLRTQARAWAMTAATGFANPGAGLAGGRTEAGGHLATRLAERTRLTGEALYSADVSGRTRRGGVLVSVDHSLNAAWRGELGMRVAGESQTSFPQDPLEATVRAKMLGQWPSHPEFSGYGEYEQDTQIASRRLAALGGEYRFSSRGHVYARHELASSLTGAWALSESQQRLATVAGVDADLARDAHVFSEYRLADALPGREAQAAVGLRNAWRLANGIRVGGSFERVNPLAGAPGRDGPSTALSGSLDWAQDPRWKGSLRLEGRTSRESDQVLQSMAAAVKLDSAWTGLVRHQFTTGGSRSAGTNDADERFQAAFAYRDRLWDALGRWDFIYDRPPGAGILSRHVANVIGLNGTSRFPRGTSASVAWAGKLTREQSAGLVTRGLAQWLHGRLQRDIGRDWDVSLSGSVRTGASLAERQFGLGMELGRMLPGGMWLSAGFNRFGYRDDELTGEEWTRTGAFVRMRARFDESLFRRAGGGL